MLKPSIRRPISAYPEETWITLMKKYHSIHVDSGKTAFGEREKFSVYVEQEKFNDMRKLEKQVYKLKKVISPKIDFHRQARVEKLKEGDYGYFPREESKKKDRSPYVAYIKDENNERMKIQRTSLKLLREYAMQKHLPLYSNQDGFDYYFYHDALHREAWSKLGQLTFVLKSSVSKYIFAQMRKVDYLYELKTNILNIELNNREYLAIWNGREAGPDKLELMPKDRKVLFAGDKEIQEYLEEMD